MRVYLSGNFYSIQPGVLFRKYLNVDLVPGILYSVISLKKTDEFESWLSKLTFKEQGQINARLERIRVSEHFGDAKSLGNGLAELRWKSGWRIYFFKEGKDLIVLETVHKPCFSRIFGSFEPIFNSNARGNIDIRILPLAFESKIGQNNPEIRRKMGCGQSLIIRGI